MTVNDRELKLIPSKSLSDMNSKGFALLIRPDDVSIPVRVEPFDGVRTGFVETLRQAQGEQLIVLKAGSIVVFIVSVLLTYFASTKQLA